MLIKSGVELTDAFSITNQKLRQAVDDHESSFRFFTLSTIDDGEKRPQNRMVVLRSFSENWTFECFTDARSQKVDQIRDCPSTGVLFWDPVDQVQVRIQAEAIIHHSDSLASDRWERVKGSARKAYTQTVTPGRAVEDPAVAHSWPETLTDEHFAVLSFRAIKVNVLQLNGLEHLAFRFTRLSGESDWSGDWIAP